MRQRGRPAGVLTQRRVQVLTIVLAARQQGQAISYGRISRVCGLHSWRHAKRIVRDLERHGILEKSFASDFLGRVGAVEM
jgi:hypothetical protein